MIDIDRFKQVNDTFGHAEGDRVLAEIGRIIANNCRALDVAGRVGGDEFMVLMRDIELRENAVQLAERLSAEVSRAFNGGISLSIGISMYPDHGKNYDDLFNAADAALYDVKEHGRAAYKVAEGCAG